MERQHYQATESRTMCGSPIGPRTTVADSWLDFITMWSLGLDAPCTKCINAVRRYKRFQRDIATADRERAQALGLTPL